MQQAKLLLSINIYYYSGNLSIIGNNEQEFKNILLQNFEEE